jgi:fatty acid-binding protein DegV
LWVFERLQKFSKKLLQGFNTLIDSSSLRVSSGWLAKAGLKPVLKNCSNVNLIAETSSNTAIGFFVSRWEIKI